MSRRAQSRKRWEEKRIEMISSRGRMIPVGLVRGPRIGFDRSPAVPWWEEGGGEEERPRWPRGERAGSIIRERRMLYY